MNKNEFFQELEALPPDFRPIYTYDERLRYDYENSRYCPLTAVAQIKLGEYHGLAATQAGARLGMNPVLVKKIMEAADCEPHFWDGPFKRRMRRIHKTHLVKRAHAS